MAAAAAAKGLGGGAAASGLLPLLAKILPSLGGILGGGGGGAGSAAQPISYQLPDRSLPAFNPQGATPSANAVGSDVELLLSLLMNNARQDALFELLKRRQGSNLF